MVKLGYVYLSLQYMSERSGIIKKANIENIKKAISNINWNKGFENLSIDEKVELLNKTLLNIFRNYTPNKKIKFDYRQPPWMTDNIKRSLKERCKLINFFYKNGQKKTDHDKVLEKCAECTREILEAKKNYILKMTKKLEDSNAAPKTYWTILKGSLCNKFPEIWKKENVVPVHKKENVGKKLSSC